MQLHPAGPSVLAGLELGGLRIHKQAHRNPRGLKGLHHGAQRGFLSGHIQAPLRGDLLPPFWHQGDHVGLDPQRNRHHLLGGGHFQVEAGANGLAQQLHIPILDVTPVFPEVHGDPIGPTKFSQQCHRDRIRLNGSPRFTDVGDVVDIDAEAGHDGAVVGRILCSFA